MWFLFRRSDLPAFPQPLGSQRGGWIRLMICVDVYSQVHLISTLRVSAASLAGIKD